MARVDLTDVRALIKAALDQHVQLRATGGPLGGWEFIGLEKAAETILDGILRASLALPDRDAMAKRAEEEWERLEEAIVTVYAFRAGHVLTVSDIAAIELVDKCQRDDEESATEAYHRGRAEGLVERGGDELLQLVKREEKAVLDKITERMLKFFAEHRATRAEGAARALVKALKLAKDHLEHQAAWIAAKAPGYSFEALGEDMGEITDALAQGSDLDTTPKPPEANPPDPRWTLGNGKPWTRDDSTTFDVLGLVGGIELDIPTRPEHAGTIFERLNEGRNVRRLTVDDIAAWTDDQVREAELWAGAIHLNASDNDDVEIPPTPDYLLPWLERKPAVEALGGGTFDAADDLYGGGSGGVDDREDPNFF